MSDRELQGRDEKSVFTAVMSHQDFSRCVELIRDMCGIKLAPTKKTMLEGRLRKRLRGLRMHSFEDYFDYLFSTEGMEAERIHLIDVVTTNKTDFFREPTHFDYLVQTVLPAFLGEIGRSTRMKLRMWSAGCSTGEEPYTLAMVMCEAAEAYPGIRFSITATDISTRALDKAKQGIYAHERIEPVPHALRRKYLLRSRDKTRKLVRIAPELRSLVSFRRFNLTEDDFSVVDPMEIIFCRNVLIYFDRQTQEQVLLHFCQRLISGGFLFTGHSETLHGMSLPLIQRASTVYQRK